MALWPVRHVGLRALALGLAVLLWMTIAGEQTLERGLRVPLEFQQFPPGLELQGEAPAVVDVRVRGASSTISRLSPGDVVAVLDLSGAQRGRRLYQVTPEQVRVPFGVEVVQVTPSTIGFVFEESAAREVPVRPDVTGEPAPGYVIGEVTVVPAAVEMVGPASVVSRVKEAVTETIPVDGAREAVLSDVTIGFVEPTVRLRTQRRAAVRVEILPGPRERRVGNRPVQLRGVAPLLEAVATPPDVDVVLRGSREAVGRVDAAQVTAYVDLAGMEAGDYALTVLVDAPPGAGAPRVEPPTIQVRIASARR